jgi:predicted phosphoribosyltransferase
VRQLEEIERRRKVYLGDRTAVSLAGRTVIVVDDGIATGSTVRTALRAIGRTGAGKSSSRSRSHPRTRSRNCDRRSTRSFA